MCFPKYQYLNRFTFYQKVNKWLYNTLAIIFLLIANLNYKISNLQKISTNDTCTCDLDVTSIENLWFWDKFEENHKVSLSKMVNFWLCLNKIHKVTPIENGWFLAIFEENSYRVTPIEHGWFLANFEEIFSKKAFFPRYQIVKSEKKHTLKSNVSQ